MSIVKGFKVFNPDWTCSPSRNVKQYTCPGKFEENVDLDICKKGMHFCENLVDCFNYYPFNPDNKVAEVIAYGDVVRECYKSCTNKLEIVREVMWEEVLQLVNTGKNCTGRCNTGDWNTGDGNTGSWNTGIGTTGTGTPGTGTPGIGTPGTGTNLLSILVVSILLNKKFLCSTNFLTGLI